MPVGRRIRSLYEERATAVPGFHVKPSQPADIPPAPTRRILPRAHMPDPSRHPSVLVPHGHSMPRAVKCNTRSPSDRAESRRDVLPPDPQARTAPGSIVLAAPHAWGLRASTNVSGSPRSMRCLASSTVNFFTIASSVKCRARDPREILRR